MTTPTPPPKRNTPTYVGTTDLRRRSTALWKEHPHVCGDNGLLAGEVLSRIGTPPRMWGQRSFEKFSPNPITEHPHVCGDNEHQRDAVDQQVGTPPRMWGQQSTYPPAPRPSRNTPTYVGTTSRFLLYDHAPPEHPHVCGDNACSIRSAWKARGTPPRMWGQRGCGRAEPDRGRNTPTYVGTTL